MKTRQNFDSGSRSDSAGVASTDPLKLVQKAMETYGTDIRAMARRRARSKVHSEAATEDLVNSGFRQVLVWICNGGRPESVEHVANSVKRCIDFTAKRVLDKKSRRENLLEKAPADAARPRYEESTVDAVIQREFALFQTCKKHVMKKENRAVLLCFSHGMTASETSEFLRRKGYAELSERAIAQRMHRMQKLLKERMLQEMAESE